jgi:hypothetical protein
MEPENHNFHWEAEKMTRQVRRFIATALAIAAFAFTTSAATAQSFTGNWPATVTKSQRLNGTYCVALTDDGSFGWPHSGEAVLLPNNGQYPGYFTVIDGLLTVTFTYPSGEGDCCDYFVFTAHTNNGKIAKGAVNYFGITDNGLVAFGKKDSCS